MSWWRSASPSAALHARRGAGQDQARRVTRILRGILRRQRATRIGPDLSHRRTIVARVLRARAVRAVVAAEAREKHDKYRPGLLQARKYAFEIAANYSHAFVQIRGEAAGPRLEPRVRRREVQPRRDAQGGLRGQRGGVRALPPQPHGLPAAVVRRSTTRVTPIPHIAAGINLEHPGRRAPAAQGRRVLHPPHASRGNALYTVVFMKYLAAIMARGHSHRILHRGWPSRTGRLLQPKTGMLSMTVRSFLRDPVRPVVFVPVYFGYERIVEANTYISELSGAPKKKESWLDLLPALRVLRERFGTRARERRRADPAQRAARRSTCPTGASSSFDDDTRAAAP